MFIYCQCQDWKADRCKLRVCGYTTHSFLREWRWPWKGPTYAWPWKPSKIQYQIKKVIPLPSILIGKCYFCIPFVPPAVHSARGVWRPLPAVWGSGPPQPALPLGPAQKSLHIPRHITQHPPQEGIHVGFFSKRFNLGRVDCNCFTSKTFVLHYFWKIHCHYKVVSSEITLYPLPTAKC